MIEDLMGIWMRLRASLQMVAVRVSVAFSGWGRMNSGGSGHGSTRFAP